jgi:hypothetical protein
MQPSRPSLVLRVPSSFALRSPSLASRQTRLLRPDAPWPHPRDAAWLRRSAHPFRPA